jgi:hypothetical protein
MHGAILNVLYWMMTIFLLLSPVSALSGSTALQPKSEPVLKKKEIDCIVSD